MPLIIRIPTVSPDDDQRNVLRCASILHDIFGDKTMHFFDSEAETTLLV